MALIECVPNISEGRRPGVINALAEAVAAVDGVRLLDHSADPTHHRSVFTFAGEAVTLYRSRLSRAGARYEALERIALG